MLWIQKPEILFDVGSLKYYMPGPNLTWEEQANSLVRFVIYLSLIMYLYNGNPLHLLLPPLMMMGIQYYLYRTDKLQRILIQIFNSRPTDVEFSNDMPQAGNFDSAREASATQNIPSADKGINTNATSSPDADDDVPPGDDDVIESFDMGVQRRIKHPMDLHADAAMEKEVDRLISENIGKSRPDSPGPYDGYATPLRNRNSPQEPRQPHSTVGPRPDMGLLPAEPGFYPKEISCKDATNNNPFGNAMPFDTIERQVNKVCPDEFKKDEKFYNKLFHGVDDLFGRNNSQRQFTTNPTSTRVNDREAAIQFFYNTPYTEH
tara:strand:- start:151 stop:1107 length:957 start_codon:yes stop_codon:yes gene_type:complete